MNNKSEKKIAEKVNPIFNKATGIAVGVGVFLLLVIISILTSQLPPTSIFRNHEQPEYTQREILYNNLNAHVKLPPGETPDISFVNDLSKIAKQKFFKDAKIGDVVMLFRSSQMAYLYRKSTDKLINSVRVSIYDISSIPNPNPSAAPASSVITPTSTL